MGEEENSGIKIKTCTAGTFSEGINVYDCINFFYESGEEWERYFSRKDAEEFIRRQAFQGADSAQLLDSWNRISCLLIYAVNAELYIEDFRPDDYVYCISWCIRNIAEFLPGYDYIKGFLSCINDLRKFLAAKYGSEYNEKILSKTMRLLFSKQNKLLPMTEEGELYDAYMKKRNNILDDFPYSIFLNQPDAMELWDEEVKSFMTRSEFKKDIAYAANLFFGNSVDADEIEKMPPSLYKSFVEYFIFDYNLHHENMDRKFIYIFLDYYLQKGFKTVKDKQITFLNYEFCKAGIKFFTVEAEGDRPGFYLCKNFFTEEYRNIFLPLESLAEAKDFIFTGHIMSDGNLASDYTRGLQLSHHLHKKIRETVSRVKDWAAIQNPDYKNWNYFLSNNTALVINFIAFSSTLTIGRAFPYRTKIKNYRAPEKYVPCHVMDELEDIAEMLEMPYRERMLLFNLWTDFLSATAKKEIKNIRSEAFLWALAVLFIHIQINDENTISLDEFALKGEISREAIGIKVKEISDVLAIEEFDPRYVTEEGLIKMLIN